MPTPPTVLCQVFHIVRSNALKKSPTILLSLNACKCSGSPHIRRFAFRVEWSHFQVARHVCRMEEGNIIPLSLVRNIGRTGKRFAHELSCLMIFAWVMDI